MTPAAAPGGLRPEVGLGWRVSLSRCLEVLTVRRLAPLLAPVLLAGFLSACGGGNGSDLPSVAGAYGAKPKITIAKGSTPAPTLESTLLRKGSGPVVRKGDLLVADYLGETYASQKVFDNSYDRKVPAAFPIGVGGVIGGWDKVLVGTRVGSRVLMTVPPKFGYGKQGNANAGIKPKDTLVFVVDVIARYPKTAAATKATPVATVPPGFPKVTGALGSAPTITVPAGTPVPARPTVTVLAKGSGPAVQRGKLVVLQYVAVDWTGKTLGSSWTKGPQGVPLGGQQATPFDLLTGVPVGSRVLLRLPPPTGQDAKTSSVAAVLDVVAQHGPAKAAG